MIELYAGAKDRNRIVLDLDRQYFSANMQNNQDINKIKFVTYLTDEEINDLEKRIKEIKSMWKNRAKTED